MRHRAFLSVNLAYLEHNLNIVHQLAPKARVMPMVKGNAYGHGMIPVTQFLTQELGYDTIGVASLGEANAILDEIPTFFNTAKSRRLVVFSDAELQDSSLHQWYAKFPIIPVCHTLQDAKTFLSTPALNKVPFYLKVNTGMCRNGVDLFPDIEKICDFLCSPSGTRAKKIDHLMQHFAQADGMNSPRIEEQLSRWRDIKKYIQGRNVEVAETSTSNSGAIFQRVGVDETWVRPGLMMYGPAPIPLEAEGWKGRQISKFMCKVLSAMQRKKGDMIGYGDFALEEDSLVATINVGYADGFIKYASGARVDINGLTGRVFGNVSMDCSAVIFPPEAEGKIKAEDAVEIWNHDPRSIGRWHSDLKTNAYQVMCCVSSRIPRRYFYQADSTQ